ncbi:MAG TPA: hypothetical protein PLV92_24610, partial [Pirellulaceae bacterium]|nr:hypothetical protein [Pirellulaceae bacterium]
LLVDDSARLTISGAAVVSGELQMSPGTTLEVTGAGATFQALAAAWISGANLWAKAGGLLSLPTATHYSHSGTAANQHRSLLADGPNSRLELPNLSAVFGGRYYNDRLFITASNSGVVDLSGARQILDPSDGDTNYRSIDVVATGASSRMQLDALESIVDQNGYDFGNGMYSTLAARNGGTVVAPHLVELDGVNLEISQGGSLDLQTLTTLRDGRVQFNNANLALPLLATIANTTATFDGSDVSLPLLTKFERSALTLDNGGTASAPSLARIDASSFVVNDGVTLSLPAATSYAFESAGANWHRVLQADGSGSRLELPNIRQIVGGHNYNNRLFVTASAGGVIDLSNASQIQDPSDGDGSYRSVDIVATGAGSRVELDALTEIRDRTAYDFGSGMYSTLAARAGGTIDAPLLTSATGVNLEISGGGALSTSQITQFVNGRISLDGATADMS